MPDILVIDNDEDRLEVFVQRLATAGFVSVAARVAATAFDELAHHSFSAIVIDVNFPGNLVDRIISTVASSQLNGEAVIFIISGIPYPHSLRHVVIKNYKIKVLSEPISVDDRVKALKSKISPPDQRLDYDGGINAALQSSVSEVIKFYLGDELVLGDIKIKPTNEKIGPIVSFARFTGRNIFGTLLFSFERNLIEKVGCRMLKEKDGSIFDDEILSDIANEICNQVSGKTRNFLIDSGMDVEISLPNKMTGENLIFVHPASNKIGMIPFGFPRKGLIARFGWGSARNSHVEYCFDSV